MTAISSRSCPAWFSASATATIICYPGFLEDDITLIDRKLLLTAGSKVLRTNYTGVNFEPSVRLMWTPTDKQTFWVSYTHALRTPSDAEEDFYFSSFLGTAPSGVHYFARFNPIRISRRSS